MAEFREGVSTLFQIIEGVDGFVTDRSLIDVTKAARVEPITVVSRDLMTVEWLPDVLQSLLSIFTGYYLQAVSLTSATVNNVQVNKILDRLNPERGHDIGVIAYDSVKDAATSTENYALSIESYKYKLPNVATEASMFKEDPEFDESESRAYHDPESKNASNTIVHEASNLAVGKVITVTFEADSCGGKDKRTIKIPVIVKLATVTVGNSSIVHILSNQSQDASLIERYHLWRAGRISFIKDLVFCQDLITEYRNANISDDTDVLQEIRKRAHANKVKGAMDRAPSLATASNLFVLSAEVAKELELKLGGKLSSPLIRQKAFKATYAMIIAVVDREYDRVLFYHRDIAQPTSCSLRDIQSSNKSSSKGPDITDVLRAYQMGNAPSF